MPTDDLNQASELFMDTVCDAGTSSIDCQLCGRLHFAAGEQSCLSREEIERLRVLAKEHPDQCCESHEDGIAFGYIDGRQAVWSCPCGKLRRYEEFIWNNRDLIVRYIKARTQSDLATANHTLSQMAAL